MRVSERVAQTWLEFIYLISICQDCDCFGNIVVTSVVLPLNILTTNTWGSVSHLSIHLSYCTLFLNYFLPIRKSLSFIIPLMLSNLRFQCSRRRFLKKNVQNSEFLILKFTRNKLCFVTNFKSFGQLTATLRMEKGWCCLNET